MEPKYVTQGLDPKDVFTLFEEISQIARPTGNPANQKAMIDWIEATLQAKGVKTRRDEVGNLFARKEASAGYESAPGVLLQAHVDMVCAPNEDIFPLKLVVDGDYLHADGTSCGLDNGMGVALAMALLMDDSFAHGLIEGAFSLNEDTDCYGAINMKPGYVQSRYMISLDDESWGKICIGSAGAEAYTHILPYVAEDIAPVLGERAHIAIRVSGLTGGHSGYSIHKNQANAIRIAATLLQQVCDTLGDVRLVSIDGGMADNAIPMNCEVKLCIRAEQRESLYNLISRMSDTLKQQYEQTDPDMTIMVEDTTAATSGMGVFDTETLAICLTSCLNGPLVFHENEDGTKEIQTSSNLASIKSESDKITIRTLSRSSVKAELESVTEALRMRFMVFSSDVESINHSSALCWQPDWQSSLLKTAKEAFCQLNGFAPEVYAPHCYMEGAYFAQIHGVLPIALGPQIDGAHTVEERVKISTVGKCRDLVVKIISALSTER